MTPVEVVFWLIIGHCVADFPLQGDFLAKAKNHRAPMPGVPWWACLAAHSAICAGAVMLVLDWPCAVLEFVVHTLIDFLKNDGALGDGEQAFAIDQGLHVGWKIMLFFWWSV